jgi:hypothetical protein
MKVTEHIAKAKSTLFSIEILPPLKGETIETLFETMDELMEFSPAKSMYIAMLAMVCWRSMLCASDRVQ